ncbi:hypothetical protein ACFQU7_31150 [Pseudoroseomonas wenyumeiae]
MTLSSAEIYRSQNGDTWWLIRDDASHQVYVRHEANPASGGHVTEISVKEFLSCRGSGPEYAATQELLKAKDEETKLLARTASLPPDESA